MAVKATDSVTIAVGVDVASVDTWYKLQPSTSAAPAKPTTASPSGWSQTEPTYDGTSTNTLYTCQKTTLTDNSFYWGNVSKSSSYEAAKVAYNEAQAAKQVATTFLARDSSGIMIAENLDNDTETPLTATGRNVFIDSDSVDIRDGQTVKASFGEIVNIGEQSGISYVAIDYHSLKLVGNDGAFFTIEDMRDQTGYAHLSESYEGNGTAKSFLLAFSPKDETSTLVYVDGVFVPKDRISGMRVYLDTAPAAGSIVTIYYQTNSSDTKAYSLGTRHLTAAKGAYSFITGKNVEASGTYSCAEGCNTSSRGVAAHAEGWSTLAKGAYSHAEGIGTEASGLYSHAQNWGTCAGGRSQTAIGEYNVIDTTTTGSNRSEYVFIVGNGTADDSRSNALAVDWNGNVEASGDITDGGGNVLSNKIESADLPATQSLVPIGTILDFAAATPPTGYLTCDGSAVSRTDYAALFAVIGTTWGAGDGSTTFNLPDFRGRTSIGAGTGTATDATAHALASSGGTENHAHATKGHKLTAAESGVPAHSHQILNSAIMYNNASSVTTRMATSGSGTKISANTNLGYSTYDNTAAAASSAHDHGNTENGSTMQPFATVTKIIRAL